MKIAIIGSRDFPESEVIKWLENNIVNGNEIKTVEYISGGARGVDSYAEEWLKKKKLPIEVIRPINPANKLDYLFRNVEIITKADKIIAFWDKKSKGSAFTIKYALLRNKDIEVIQPNGEVINNEKLRNLLRESTSF